ncbi:SEC-C metal-binding domain-containing protein [Paractinoplanes rhizophilus]|uniref:SEC-C metal-binding domain-containing protein n=1 Tax=Paractinoplanes rhizophilus TaxID=1416877 RepID=A0ABW2HS91_9ACTN
MVTRWPHLAAEVVGAPWAEHRRQVEQNCAYADRQGFAVNLVPGNLPDFEIFLEHRGITTPSADDLRAYPDVRDAEAVMVAWPPNRSASCWCGSGRRYKQCYRPHGLGSLS